MNRAFDRLVQLAHARECGICHKVRLRMADLAATIEEVAERDDLPQLVATFKMDINCPLCRNLGYVVTATGKSYLSMLLSLDDSDVVEVIGRPR
jgi:hypothetical protein